MCILHSVLVLQNSSAVHTHTHHTIMPPRGCHRPTHADTRLQHHRTSTHRTFSAGPGAATSCGLKAAAMVGTFASSTSSSSLSSKKQARRLRLADGRDAGASSSSPALMSTAAATGPDFFDAFARPCLVTASAASELLLGGGTWAVGGTATTADAEAGGFCA